MEKSSQIAWIIVPLRHLFPLNVVPLIEVLLYTRQYGTRVSDTRYDSRMGWVWQVSCEKVGRMRTTELHQQASPDSQ
jgi:hypothetical protein